MSEERTAVEAGAEEVQENGETAVGDWRLTATVLLIGGLLLAAGYFALGIRSMQTFYLGLALLWVAWWRQDDTAVIPALVYPATDLDFLINV